MCRTVTVDGDEIEDTKELSEKLGVPAMLQEGCDWVLDPDGECLCNCDVVAMAQAAGAKYKRPVGDEQFWGINWVITTAKSAGVSG